jgi:hypothetical protein
MKKNRKIILEEISYKRSLLSSLILEENNLSKEFIKEVEKYVDTKEELKEVYYSKLAETDIPNKELVLFEEIQTKDESSHNEEIPQNKSLKVIYNRLVKILHPDVSKIDPSFYIEATNAYSSGDELTLFIIANTFNLLSDEDKMNISISDELAILDVKIKAYSSIIEEYAFDEVSYLEYISKKVYSSTS